MANNSFFDFIQKLLKLFFPSKQSIPPTSSTSSTEPSIPAVMNRKVLIIDFRPDAVPSTWSQSDDLAKRYISVMQQASANRLVYQVVSKQVVKNYPMLKDGRQYNDTTWKLASDDDQKAFRDAQNNYVQADYQRIIQDFKLVEQVQNQQIDEVWLFGGPYFGFYESCMVGKGAFWCNGPAFEQNCSRFVIMGYNYQRDIREMVHDFGHRAENILAHQFDSLSFLYQIYSPTPPTTTPKNDFENFLVTHGTVHRKPGGANYSQDEIAWVTALKPEWLVSAIDPNRA